MVTPQIEVVVAGIYCSWKFCSGSQKLHCWLYWQSFEVEVYKCIFILAGNEGNIFQIDEDTGNITMTKAADIVGPIILTVLVSNIQYLILQVCQMSFAKRFNLLPLGITGDQQGPVRCHIGDDWGDEEEQKPAALWQGALRRFHLQQLYSWEHGPAGPHHKPTLQGSSPRRGLCHRESQLIEVRAPKFLPCWSCTKCWFPSFALSCWFSRTKRGMLWSISNSLSSNFTRWYETPSAFENKMILDNMSGCESRCEVRGPVQQLRQCDGWWIRHPEESGEDWVLRTPGDSCLTQSAGECHFPRMDK